MSNATRQRWLLSLIAAACTFSACNTPLPRPPAAAASAVRLAPARAAEPVMPADVEAEAAAIAPDETAVAPDAPEAAPAGDAEAADGAWIEELLAARTRALDADARAAIAATLLDAEREVGLDPLLVLAVMAQESRFDPAARGPRGSLGLMQVRPFVGRDVAQRTGVAWDGPTTLLDPARNVALGVAYLAEMIGMFADVELALTAYNMGPYRLRRLLRRGVEPRRRYAERVFAHHADLTALAFEIDPGSCPAEYC